MLASGHFLSILLSCIERDQTHKLLLKSSLLSSLSLLWPQMIRKKDGYLTSDQIRSVAQSCPTLCDPMDHSPPGSSVQWNSPGKNTRKWIAISFSKSFGKTHICCVDDLEFTEKKMKTIKITDNSRGIPTANVLVCLLPVTSCLFCCHA